jgi:WD40 repeat protein
VAQQLAGRGQLSLDGQVQEVVETQPAPYLGLAAFQPDDVDRFFGRENMVADLISRLRGSRFLAVFGPSGSGKSSLLRAGLIPAVRNGGFPGAQDWPIVLLTPGKHPLEELAVHVASLCGVSPGSLRTDLEADPASMGLAVRQALLSRPPQAQMLLVVDQFEEVFTLCRDEGERVGFIDALLATVGGSENRATVVLGVRADFYSRCADHPDLVAALQDAQVLVGPMGPDAFRAVIIRPATQAGLAVEPALVATILADVAGRPGALPLLSHALLETWRRRQGRRLTLAGYQAAGRVQGAITQTAEQVYAELDTNQQRIARRVFLRLTALGEGTQDTRRRVSRSELDADGELPETTVVVDRLVTARLVMLGEDTAEVAHEALIQAWPRLRQWLTDDRAGLRTHRQLTEAAQAWKALDRDPGALYRGVRLTLTREWADRDEHRGDLNPLERAFLDASTVLETTERAVAQRRIRQLRRLVAALVVLLVLATTVGGVAVHQRQAATSRQLAAGAAALVASQPAVSALLSVEAFRVMPTVEARSSLLSASAHLDNHAVLPGHTSFVNGVTFSPDGRLLASAGGEDHAIILWDAASHRRLATLTGHAQAVRDVAFSPDGRLLASASRDHTVILWDVARRTRIATLTGHTARVNGLAFSPNGRLLASASDDQQLMLWDVENRARIATLAGHSARVNGVAFSPDGRLLASASADRTVMLWDVARRSATATLVGHTDAVRGVAFSPDGQMVASAGADRTVILWDTTSRSHLATLTGHTGPVTGVAFSPDGQTLASASNDHTVMLWYLSARTLVATLAGHSNWVSRVVFSPDGRTLASSSGDQTVIVWSPVMPPFSGHTDAVTEIALSPQDGHTLASASADRTIMLWDVNSRSHLATLTGHTGPVTGVAFSPDGRILASASADRTIMLWDVNSRSRLATLNGHADSVTDVAFSPDGRILASASADRTIMLWDVNSRSRLATLNGHADSVTDVAFSPDGQTLASTGSDQSIVLWDVAHRSQIARLPMHSDGARMAFSPDGHVLATATSNRTIILWDLTSRARLATLQDHLNPVLTLAFSPDGGTLASGGGDGTIVLWDVAHRARLAALTGHTDRVNSLIFSPDGHTLISASADHTVIAWNTNPQQTTTRICTVFGRNLTREEWSQFAPGISYHQTCS